MHRSARISINKLALLPNASSSQKNASDVSRIVKILAGGRVRVAIRGGGHTPIANAANIENAVTIDLSGLNVVSLGSTTNDLALSAESSSSSIARDVSPSSIEEKRRLTGSSILSAGGGAT